MLYLTSPTPQLSGLMKHTNGTIKTQIGEFSKGFNFPWSKSLLIVLLNLKSTSFGKHLAFLLVK